MQFNSVINFCVLALSVANVAKAAVAIERRVPAPQISGVPPSQCWEEHQQCSEIQPFFEECCPGLTCASAFPLLYKVSDEALS